VLGAAAKVGQVRPAIFLQQVPQNQARIAIAAQQGAGQNVLVEGGHAAIAKNQNMINFPIQVDAERALCR
jgi:hypothetical protein